MKALRSLCVTRTLTGDNVATACRNTAVGRHGEEVKTTCYRQDSSSSGRSCSPLRFRAQARDGIMIARLWPGDTASRGGPAAPRKHRHPGNADVVIHERRPECASTGTIRPSLAAPFNHPAQNIGAAAGTSASGPPWPASHNVDAVLPHAPVLMLTPSLRLFGKPK